MSHNNPFLTMGLEYLKTRYSIAHQKWQQEEALKRYQTMQQYHSFAQMRLHNTLGNILRETTVTSRLCPIRDVNDLIPNGFEIYPETTIYSFVWIKKEPSEIFPAIICQRIMNRINQVIRNKIIKYNEIYQTLDDRQRYALIQSEPALYNGFRIVACLDDTDCIILKVEFD